MGRSRYCIILVWVALLGACASVLGQTNSTWPYYGGDAGGTRYSPLAQINSGNVSTLKVAWVFHTGDVSDGQNGKQRSGFETTPILVDGTLFVTTGFNRVIALDPASGKERWSYDPKVDLTGDYGDGLVNRGVATWLDPIPQRNGKPCQRRIYEATLDARLIALDAKSGLPCSDFGESGQVSLRDVPRYKPGRYHMTSPPAVIDDLVIAGSAINDNTRADMPGGAVRAFDVRTGILRWTWDPISSNDAAPPPVRGNSTVRWKTGAANAWSIMTADPERGLVFIPTGSASPDFYGGLRPGDNRWANSVVALHAKTGELVWGFQLVHHDLWDYDTAPAPLLATLHQGSKQIPVVVAGNKAGFLYVLNRDTGAPIFPVEERAVPQSDVPGEITSPTQPIPVAPPPVAPQQLSAAEAWGATPADVALCRKWISSFRNEGIFTPPSLQGTLEVPGYLGGMTWSGYAFDPGRNLLLVRTNNLAAVVRLIPSEKLEAAARSGEEGDYEPQTGAPYGMYRRFLQGSSDLPCSSPPWGMLSAIDLERGTIRWQVPLGSMQQFGGDHGTTPPGSIGLGGPIVTAGRLVFIAGTVDRYIRSFDVETGKELWKGQLPASGNATPMTYSLNGKQYLVIAAGGHPKIPEEARGDALVAFTLP